MSKQNRDVELARLVHDKPLSHPSSSPSHRSLAEQLPNVPSYRSTTAATSRIPVFVARKQKAGVTNPSFLKEEGSSSHTQGNVAFAMALCVQLCVSGFLCFVCLCVSHVSASIHVHPVAITSRHVAVIQFCIKREKAKSCSAVLKVANGLASQIALLKVAGKTCPFWVYLLE